MVPQTPEIDSLSSPKACALFSLFSHLLSFSIMLTGRGAGHSFKWPQRLHSSMRLSEREHTLSRLRSGFSDQIVIHTAPPFTEK